MSTIDLHARRADRDLVALVRRGDTRAFDTIVERHRPALLAHARRIVRSPQDAEEIVQDALLKTHRALLASDREIALTAWLHTLVRNGALDQLRRRRPQAPLELLPPVLADRGPSPAEAAEQREALGAVLGGLRALPPRQRDALVLHALGGASHEQIAGQLGVSCGASKTLLCRARSGLRRELAVA